MAAMIALETDYAHRGNPGDQGTDSEDGVAVAGSATLGRFAGVPDAEARAMVSAMSADLHAAETREIAFRIKERQSTPDWDGKSIAFPADEQLAALECEPQRGAGCAGWRSDRGTEAVHGRGGLVQYPG